MLPCSLIPANSEKTQLMSREQPGLCRGSQSQLSAPTAVSLTHFFPYSLHLEQFPLLSPTWQAEEPKLTLSFLLNTKE